MIRQNHPAKDRIHRNPFGTPAMADKKPRIEPDDPRARHDDHVSMIEAPPTAISGILRRLGPGLIIAGSIVGSGELIATTKVGAVAGFSLLWLILIGCVIKVFAQIEFGRYSVIHGRTAMDGMNEVPGPRLGANWLIWYWCAMFLASLGQLGGIVGGVGQALAISAPLTEYGQQYNVIRESQVELKRRKFELEKSPSPDLAEKVATLEATVEQQLQSLNLDASDDLDAPRDALIWATIITVITAALLYIGHYGFIQTFATVMVASFTLVTIVNVFGLQSHPDWAISWSDIRTGLSFGLPAETGKPGTTPLGVALAAFGIIGVGASELVAYPYWCLEKGYARFVGPRDDSAAWGERARGWMRVMYWDAWCSMVVYTFATIAFYLLGASVLSRSNLDPSGSEMIRTLSVMYAPVFGNWAKLLFLFGAFAVLYSTFFVAIAGNTRVVADAMRVVKLREDTVDSRRRWIGRLSVIFPFFCLTVYALNPEPVKLVLLGGLMQAIMLPMLAGATLYFRYRRNDARVTPGRVWDVFLAISALGLLITGVWAAKTEIQNVAEKLSSSAASPATDAAPPVPEKPSAQTDGWQLIFGNPRLSHFDPAAAQVERVFRSGTLALIVPCV